MTLDRYSCDPPAIFTEPWSVIEVNSHRHQLSLIQDPDQPVSPWALGNAFGWLDPSSGKRYSHFDCPLLSGLQLGDQVPIRIEEVTVSGVVSVGIDAQDHAIAIVHHSLGQSLLNRELCRQIKENQYFEAVEQARCPSSQGVEAYWVRRGRYEYFRYWYRIGDHLHRRHIPGGQTHTALAIKNADCVREWISRGLKPREIIEKIKFLTTDHPAKHQR